MNPRISKLLLFTAAGLAGLILVILAAGALRSPDFEVEAAVDVARPPAAVYEALVHAENLPQWSQGLDRVEKVSDSPLRYRVTAGGRTTEMEYFDLDPPRRFRSRMAMPEMGYSGEWELTIAPLASGSRVTSRAHLHFDSVFWRSLALFMDGQAEERKTLEQFKAWLER